LSEIIPFFNNLIIHYKGSFSFYLNSLNLAQKANISANLLRVSILNTSVWEIIPTRGMLLFFISLCIPCDMSWTLKTRIYVVFEINRWATCFKSPDSSWTPALPNLFTMVTMVHGGYRIFWSLLITCWPLYIWGWCKYCLIN
jgi:hypothetical protein